MTTQKQRVQQEQKRIFISYSRRDRDFVDELVQRLEILGFDCWLDRQDLDGGAAWREEISRSIQACHACVLVVSSESVASPIVMQEISLADHYGRPIIPLRYEACDVPPGLDLQISHLQWVDFSVEPFDDAIIRLETALTKTTGLEGNGHGRTVRTLNAWAPWVGVAYGLSGLYFLAAFLMWEGGWYGVLSPEQQSYLKAFTAVDRLFGIVIAALHIVGASYLLRQRAPAFPIFLADWCVYSWYVIQGVVLMKPQVYAFSTFLTYGVLSCAVWYVGRMKQYGLLAHAEGRSDYEYVDPPARLDQRDLNVAIAQRSSVQSDGRDAAQTMISHG